MVFSEMPPLLLELWREQHPEGHEQTRLNFNARGPAAAPVPLFAGLDTLEAGVREEVAMPR